MFDQISAIKLKKGISEAFIHTVPARIVPAASIKGFRDFGAGTKREWVLFECGLYFFIFCLLAILKIKNAVLRRKKYLNQKLSKINWT